MKIDPDIRRASTLPAEAYRDPDLFDRARERVFAPSWQLAGDAGRLRAPGQVLPFTLLEGCLDEPLVLTRDRNDGLHCVSNVCTHRGNLVVGSAGTEQSLRCRYHGRRFGLDGRFQSMPEFEGLEDFPCESDDLPRLPLERWGDFLFTSLDPACTFGELIEPIEARLAWLPLSDFVLDPARSRDYLVQCN